MRSFLRRLTSKIPYLHYRIRKPNKKKLGKVGEAVAYRYLKRIGYIILEKNYTTPIGEIDIIAEDGDILVFVEVKTRRSDNYGLPEEVIDLKKIRKLTRLAQLYIKNKSLYHREARFDVVSILAQGRFCKKRIKLIKNAFYAEE